MTSPQQGSNNLGISGKSTNGQGKSQRYQQPATFLKYDLQRAAQSILHDHNKAAHEQHRTCWCHRGVARAIDSVAVYRQESGKSARLHVVTPCKSVWACPVCSAKICAVRQSELELANKSWVGKGGQTFLLTLTFPHERGVPLAQLLHGFTRAKGFFKNSRTYKRILAKGVRTGSVSSLEVTLGQHGWHPHQHDLIFATADCFGTELEQGEKLTTEQLHAGKVRMERSEDGRLSSRLIDELKDEWYTALRKAGMCEQHQLQDVLKHGLDVRGGQFAADYIAKFGKEQKWGLSREVTMHASKVGSDSKGAHPFQLLAWAMEGDGQSAADFREYQQAFEGKRMLSWSRGLKKELTGEDETTDDAAADKEMPEESVVGRIDSAALAILQSRRLLANFLQYVAEHCHDPATAQEMIDGYLQLAREEYPRSARGEVKVKMWSRGFMHVDREKEVA
jgi:hypothetical protein